MTHPITPPPELVQQWIAEWMDEFDKRYHSDMFVAPGQAIIDIAKRAAQWGYEQHERELLDAMHAIVPQPYEPEFE